MLLNQTLKMAFIVKGNNKLKEYFKISILYKTNLRG